MASYRYAKLANVWTRTPVASAHMPHFGPTVNSNIATIDHNSMMRALEMTVMGALQLLVYIRYNYQNFHPIREQS